VGGDGPAPCRLSGIFVIKTIEGNRMKVETDIISLRKPIFVREEIEKVLFREFVDFDKKGL